MLPAMTATALLTEALARTVAMVSRSLLVVVGV